MHVQPRRARKLDSAVSRTAIDHNDLVHPFPPNLGNDDPNGLDLVEGRQQQRCGEFHSAPVSTETFLRSQSWVSRKPSAMATFAFQPRRAARPTSISFLGIPSGLSGLNTTPPGYPAPPLIVA